MVFLCSFIIHTMTTVDEAFRRIKRTDFVPADLRQYADIDAPLSIGYGQTISQPSTVRFMLNLLRVEQGHKVLDIGSGSGWTTALLSYLVGPEGMVYAVERIPDLLEFGQQNCRRVGVKNAKFFTADKQYGLPKHAPFDRILVSAAAQKLPDELLAQLKVSGKIVIPVNNDILEVDLLEAGRTSINKYHGFIFVPLV